MLKILKGVFLADLRAAAGKYGRRTQYLLPIADFKPVISQRPLNRSRRSVIGISSRFWRIPKHFETFQGKAKHPGTY